MPRSPAAAIPVTSQNHLVLDMAPRQPSVAFSRTHFPAAQICMTLSATQKPAPSLNERLAQAQPLGGTGTSGA
jgi:hypothetical protein